MWYLFLHIGNENDQWQLSHEEELLQYGVMWKINSQCQHIIPVSTNTFCISPYMFRVFSDESLLEHESFWTGIGWLYLGTALLSPFHDALMHSLHLKNLLHFFLVCLLQETTVMFNMQCRIVELKKYTNDTGVTPMLLTYICEVTLFSEVGWVC
jgi:hypothetical protein